MSRSQRKTPIMGWSDSKGQKQFRTQENRAKRRQINIRIQQGLELMPDEKEYGNEWASPRDGKQRLDPPYDRSNKWMRK